jgi:uroporphyrinogen decarboxylase
LSSDEARDSKKARSFMMTSRQRMLQAMEFKAPDKIPVVYHPSPAGLYVHGKKLLDLFNAYPPDNPVCFDAIPCPPAGTVDAAGKYHEIRKDEWGTTWQHLIYGVWGHPLDYPFESWEAATEYAFPPLPTFDNKQVAEQGRDYLVFAGTISIFERLTALRPMDQALMDILTEDPALLCFLDRLVEYWLTYIHDMIDAGIDVIMFGDDWGTQCAPIIPPGLFRKLFIPRYEKLMAPIHKAGRKVFFHCCGFLEGTLDELIGLGINGLWPQIGLFESNPSLFDKCIQNKVALYIHPDRQYLVPRGTPKEIKSAVKKYARKYHDAQGGGIFYVEIENDAPFENVKALVEAIHRWR